MATSQFETTQRKAEYPRAKGENQLLHSTIAYCASRVFYFEVHP